jgi:hypothetical protein
LTKRCPRSERRGDSSNPTQYGGESQPRKPGPDSLGEGVIPWKGPRPSTHRAVQRIAADPVRTAVSQNARRLVRQDFRRQSDFHLKDDVSARSLAHNSLLANPCPLAHGHLPPCTYSTGHQRSPPSAVCHRRAQTERISRRKRTAQVYPGLFTDEAKPWPGGDVMRLQWDCDARSARATISLAVFVNVVT